MTRSFPTLKLDPGDYPVEWTWGSETFAGGVELEGDRMPRITIYGEPSDRTQRNIRGFPDPVPINHIEGRLRMGMDVIAHDTHLETWFPEQTTGFARFALVGGFQGGDANLYSYVRNDPVHLVDPFGLLGFNPLNALTGAAREIAGGIGSAVQEVGDFGSDLLSFPGDFIGVMAGRKAEVWDDNRFITNFPNVCSEGSGWEHSIEMLSYAHRTNIVDVAKASLAVGMMSLSAMTTGVGAGDAMNLPALAAAPSSFLSYAKVGSLALVAASIISTGLDVGCDLLY